LRLNAQVSRKLRGICREVQVFHRAKCATLLLRETVCFLTLPHGFGAGRDYARVIASAQAYEVLAGERQVLDTLPKLPLRFAG
jgi:hypothetical protein